MVVGRDFLEEARDGVDDEGREVQDHGGEGKILDGRVGDLLEFANLLLAELGRGESSEHVGRRGGKGRLEAVWRG